MYKICPSCGTKNQITETLCINCMADISSVNPLSESQSLNEQKIIQKTNEIQEKENKILYLVLLENQNMKIKITNNAIIGRYHLGKEIFEKLSNPKLISRQHVNIFFKDTKWYVRDLNSTNGTYLKDLGNLEFKLEPYKDYELRENYVLSLAKIIYFIIKENFNENI